MCAIDIFIIFYIHFFITKGKELKKVLKNVSKHNVSKSKSKLFYRTFFLVFVILKCMYTLLNVYKNLQNSMVFT